MSNQRIIYPTAGGGVAIIIPAPNCELPIEQIALKDVPANTPYRIVNASDIPTDRSERNRWSADFTNPDGTGLGADAWFAAQQQNGGE